MTIQEFATAAGLNKKTVALQVPNLARLGLARIVPRRPGDGRGHPTHSVIIDITAEEAAEIGRLLKGLPGQAKGYAFRRALADLAMKKFIASGKIKTFFS